MKMMPQLMSLRLREADANVKRTAWWRQTDIRFSGRHGGGWGKDIP